MGKESRFARACRPYYHRVSEARFVIPLERHRIAENVLKRRTVEILLWVRAFNGKIFVNAKFRRLSLPSDFGGNKLAIPHSGQYSSIGGGQAVCAEVISRIGMYVRWY